MAKLCKEAVTLPAPAAWLLWRFNCASDSPLQVGAAQPGSQNLLANSSVSRKVCECVFLTSVLKEKIRNAVVCLLRLCGPADIARLVVAIVVGEPIKRVRCGWSLPDIGKEVDEISPPITHHDAAFSVVVKSWVRRLGAARNHIGPARVCRRAAIGSRSVPVLFAHASARSVSARSQIVGKAFALVSADTSTQHQTAAARSATNRNNRPVPVGGADHFLMLHEAIRA